MSDQQAKLSEQEMKTYRVQGFTCANSAGKLEKNVKKLPRNKDVKVNVSASKISVCGDATIEELEKAGACENLKVAPEKARQEVRQEVKEDKIVYRVEGFTCANCAGKFENNVKQ